MIFHRLGTTFEHTFLYYNQSDICLDSYKFPIQLQTGGEDQQVVKQEWDMEVDEEQDVSIFSALLKYDYN